MIVNDGGYPGKTAPQPSAGLAPVLPGHIEPKQHGGTLYWPRWRDQGPFLQTAAVAQVLFLDGAPYF